MTPLRMQGFSRCGSVLFTVWLCGIIACIHTNVDAQRLVFAAGANTCAILRLNNTRCWGKGSFNGNGNSFDVGTIAGTMGTSLPDIAWGSGLQPLALSMGGPSSTMQTQVCAVLAPLGAPSSAVLKCFGSNQFGKQGRGLPYSFGNMTIGDEAGEMTNLPSINLGTGMIPSDVSVGAGHVCAIVSTINLSTDRRVKCWGKGSTGALGNTGTANKGISTSDMGDSLPFMNIAIPVLKVAAGDDFTCVIASSSSSVSGDVYCTGLSDRGQTGQGSTTQLNSPLIVNIGSGKTARSITAGRLHVCVLIHEDSQVKCWGGAENGKIGLSLGQNAISIGDEPGEMANLLNLDFGGGTTVLEVKTAADHTCVLLSGNSVKCFGLNAAGQLGINNQLDSPGLSQTNVADIPAIEFDFNNVPVSLAVGTTHSCAIVSASGSSTLRLKCWGNAADGQLGLESLNNYGDTFASRVSFAPFVDVNEASMAPTTSPTTSRPSVSPSKTPTTSKPSRAPSTSRPSTNPSRGPTRSPSRSSAPTTAAPSLAPSPLPTKNPTRMPTTRSPVSTSAPTVDAAAAASQTIGVAVGASAGVLIFALAAFVIFKRRGSLFGSATATAAPKNWYQEALTASPDTPSQYALSAAATKATGPKAPKYNAPPVDNRPALPVATYESGNPVYQGMKGATTSVRLSTGAIPPAKPSRDAIVDKLTRFYSKVDPNKSMADINELATFVELKGEDALYTKLKNKYGVDPNDTLKAASSVVPEDVNV